MARSRTSFQPGQSGNPIGPARVGPLEPTNQRDVVVLARRHTRRAIKNLVKIMEDPNETGAARVKAAEVILSRGWGQAVQQRMDLVAHLNDKELEIAAREVLQRRSDEAKRLDEQRQKLTLDATFSDVEHTEVPRN